MRGHAGMMVFVLLVGLLVMTGCEKQYTVNETDTTDQPDTETQTESESETSPATVREGVETEKVTETRAQNLTEYESSMGYCVLYDDTVFEYTGTRDYDEFTLKSQSFSSKPMVFFAAMKLENDEIPGVIEEIFTDAVQGAVLGADDYPALCQPTAESSSDGKGLTHHNQYLVQLINGDALLFEIQWYEEEGQADDGDALADMLASIVINSPVQENIGERAQESVLSADESQPETLMADETESE